MPRRVSSIDPVKFASAQTFWTHAAGRNTAKPELIEEMKSSNFKPKKLDESSDLSAIDEGSIEAESLDESKEEEPEKELPIPEPEPKPEPVPETKAEENGVESDDEKCICNNVTDKQEHVKGNQDDLIKRLIEKVAELQNSLTYCEVENIRLEGCVSKLKLDVSKTETAIDCYIQRGETAERDKDSLNKIIETVEHNSMRVEQENRDLRVEKIMWESERRRLENSLEEARAESRLLDRSYSSIRHSSPRATALDASLTVIDDQSLKIEKLSTENATLNSLYERAEQKAREVEEENKSLRRDRLQLDMEKRDLQSSLDEAKAESRYLEDRLSISRSLSPVSKLNTSSNEQEICDTCKCRHSNPKKMCPICNCVHRSPSSSSSDVCPVCYCKYSKCPRSPRNISYSEYSPILTDLSRTF